MTKIADKNEAEIGDTVNYTIAMRTKEGVLSDAVLTDTLPDGFALDKTSVSCSSKDAEIEVSGKTITVKLPELTEESVTLTYSGKAEKAGELINVATLTGSNYTGDPIKAEAKVTVPEKPVEEEAPKETPKATPTATTKTSTPTASSGEIKSTGKVQTGDVNLALYGMIGILAFVAAAASVLFGKCKNCKSKT